MNFKASDFLFGIVDFLAFFVPGLILIITLPSSVCCDFQDSIPVLNPADSQVIGLLLFILLAYIAGHFIHHLGAMILNPVYTHVYLKVKRSKHILFLASTEKKIRAFMPGRTDLERVADAYIRVHQPSLIPEIDKHEANSKLFRGLSLLCVYLCFYAKIWQIPFLIIFSALSFSRFANQRWKRQLLIYEYFSVLTRADQEKND